MESIGGSNKTLTCFRHSPEMPVGVARVAHRRMVESRAGRVHCGRSNGKGNQDKNNGRFLPTENDILCLACPSGSRGRLAI